MATSYKKITALNPLTKVGELSTRDSIYWKNLDVPITKKEFGNITHIEFSPVSPYNYAITSSTRVQIYSSRSNQIIRSLNRFNEAANCGSFRSDGKLLVAGSDDKMVRLFEPSGRSLLRVFKGHTDAVLVTRFLADNQRLISTSSDKSVRVWDIAGETEIRKYIEFKDYIKCGVASKTSSDIFLAGAYDHTAKLFDARTEKSVMTVDHGCPVESVLLYPTDGIFLTAGGNVVKVWDALAGGKQLTQLGHHHKTITCLCFCSRYRRFMSASIDRHVKVYDVGSYQVVYSLDYPANVLSVAVAPDDSVLAVGMEGGLLSIQHRNKEARKAEEAKVKKRKVASFRKHIFKAQEEDLVIMHSHKEKLKRFDGMLKRFEHSKALDSAMETHLRSRNPEVTMGVMLELMRRGVLRAALAGREAHNLQHILRFVQRNMWKPNFRPLLDVLNIILDVYSKEIPGNAVLEPILTKVAATGDSEKEYNTELLNAKGMIESLLAMQNSIHGGLATLSSDQAD